MAKVKRSIIKIDEEKCNGCGECIPSCPEGALKIIDGKARLVRENFCDGLGACLGDCPQNAMEVVTSEVDEYDEDGVITHIKKNSPELLQKHVEHLEDHREEVEKMGIDIESVKRSIASDDSSPKTALRQWPIQLHLVPVEAPYLNQADLVLVADCVPYAYSNFHKDFLKDKTLLIGCPKLDDTASYEEKLTEIIKKANLKSIKVLLMEVPCCYGLVHVAESAIKNTGSNVPFEKVIIGVDGNVK